MIIFCIIFNILMVVGVQKFGEHRFPVYQASWDRRCYENAFHPHSSIISGTSPDFTCCVSRRFRCGSLLIWQPFSGSLLERAGVCSVSEKKRRLVDLFIPQRQEPRLPCLEIRTNKSGSLVHLITDTHPPLASSPD